MKISEHEHERTVALWWLTSRVEALSILPAQYSRIAYTHRRRMHVAFSNGQLKNQGAAATPQGERGPMELAIDTLFAIKAYRDSLPGPHLLVWRDKPEFETAGEVLGLYTRLAFDTDADSQLSDEIEIRGRV